MEIVQKTIGDAIAEALFPWEISLEPLMIGEMAPQPVIWWPFTF